MTKYKFSRRNFFKTSAIGGATLMMGAGFSPKQEIKPDYTNARLSVQELQLPSKYALDLSPSRWIWYPSARTLANTFILFRKTISILKEIKSATGWILGDSRYLLEVNGTRVQWGPPPSDPRFSEADPVDLKNFLSTGENVIGATVLYYGYGDGTWPVGKPGFIYYLKIDYADGTDQTITSDQTWDCHLARSWKPGQYKRWYLRALQEEFDARKYPFGWQSPDYSLDNTWLKAKLLSGKATQPALSTNNSDYMYDSSGNATIAELRKRSVPLLKEIDHDIVKLEEAYWIKWNRPPEDYFDVIVPDACKFHGELSFTNSSSGPWTFSLNENGIGAVLTFAIQDQMVGWPFFTIDAPEGTIIELMVQEGHKLVKDGGPVIINNHFNSWTRLICKAGENHFQPFDFESIKWIQLHIHGTKGEINIKNLGIKRRMYQWPNPPKVRTSDDNLQKLINASINTIYNNSQETVVDGMGRERQQYSGDCGHVLHALYRSFGEQQLPARYLNTFSQGLTQEGYFLDTWPAYDRLNRLQQRQLGLTKWGPLLDHGVGFNFDSYHHYLYTGDLSALDEVWPRLKQFFQYLKSIVGTDGLLPVEDFGIPAVWIDHEAYKLQRHKQCAFNLYATAMYRHAFSSLADAFHEPELKQDALSFADSLLQHTISKYWEPTEQLFICNKPWTKEEGETLLCDRSLSTAILFDLSPNGQSGKAIDVLIKKPKNLGLSYPTNTNWYLWALGKAGKPDAIFADFEQRWIKMDSVHLNNAMQEFWNVIPDSGSLWSHASIAPLLSVYMDLAGIRPIEPGYKYFKIQPQPGDLELLELDNYTPSGPIKFSLNGWKGKRVLKLNIPGGIRGELILDEKEKTKLKELSHQFGMKSYELEGGMNIELKLKYL